MGDVSKNDPTLIVGWREWVGLPGVGVEWLKAKIDTGAQTSSLHAFALEPFSRDAQDWVRFELHPWQRSAADPLTVELPVHDRRPVRSSSGHVQDRYVVLLDLRLCGRLVPAEVTLTRRDAMGFRMLVGREVLKRGFLVDSLASYKGGKPPKEVRRANRRREG